MKKTTLPIMLLTFLLMTARSFAQDNLSDSLKKYNALARKDKAALSKAIFFASRIKPSPVPPESVEHTENMRLAYDLFLKKWQNSGDPYDCCNKEMFSIYDEFESAVDPAYWYSPPFLLYGIFYEKIGYFQHAKVCYEDFLKRQPDYGDRYELEQKIINWDREFENARFARINECFGGVWNVKIETSSVTFWASNVSIETAHDIFNMKFKMMKGNTIVGEVEIDGGKIWHVKAMRGIPGYAQALETGFETLTFDTSYDRHDNSLPVFVSATFKPEPAFRRLIKDLLHPNYSVDVFRGVNIDSDSAGAPLNNNGWTMVMEDNSGNNWGRILIYK